MAKPIFADGQRLIGEPPRSLPASVEIVKELGRIRAEHLAASAGILHYSVDISLPDIRLARVFPQPKRRSRY